jgi:hypothetical protein
MLQQREGAQQRRSAIEFGRHASTIYRKMEYFKPYFEYVP